MYGLDPFDFGYEDHETDRFQQQYREVVASTREKIREIERAASEVLKNRRQKTKGIDGNGFYRKDKYSNWALTEITNPEVGFVGTPDELHEYVRDRIVPKFEFSHAKWVVRNATWEEFKDNVFLEIKDEKKFLESNSQESFKKLFSEYPRILIESNAEGWGKNYLRLEASGWTSVHTEYGLRLMTYTPMDQATADKQIAEIEKEWAKEENSHAEFYERMDKKSKWEQRWEERNLQLGLTRSVRPKRALNTVSNYMRNGEFRLYRDLLIEVYEKKLTYIQPELYEWVKKNIKKIKRSKQVEWKAKKVFK